MKKENILNLFLPVIIGVLAAVGTASAATTISTNIITEGILSVGSSTPATNALFSVGTTSPIIYVDKITGWMGFGKTNPRAPFDFYDDNAPGDGWAQSDGTGLIFAGGHVELDGLIDFTAGAHGSCTAGSCASNGNSDAGESGGWLTRGEGNRWGNVPNGAAYTVDIGTSYPVKAITWGTYWKNSDSSQFTAYTIESSTNGTDWTTIVDVSNNSRDPVLHYFPSGITMRYVRITNTGTSGAFVSNLQILGYVIQSPFSNQPWGVVAKNWVAGYNGNSNVVLRTHGGVGIGTSSIPYKLTVNENKTVNSTNVLARFQISSAGATSTAPQIYFGAHDSAQTMRNLAGVGGIISTLNTSGYQGALGFYTANNTTPAEVARFTATGNLGIGTTTPTTQLQVTASVSNATSTVTVGKVGQNKGSCLELFDSAGTAVYAYVAAGATALTLSSVSCK